MKNKRLLQFGLLFLFSYNLLQAQCVLPDPAAYYHQLYLGDCYGWTRWSDAGEHDTDHDLCDPYNGYITMFEDNFDGTSVDPTKWKRSYGHNNPDEIGIFQALNTPNYEVSNGTLKIKVLRAPGASYQKYTDCNAAPTIEYGSFTTGQIWSYRFYPTGMYEVRFKIPNFDGHYNFAPLWFWMGSVSTATEKYFQDLNVEFMDVYNHDYNLSYAHSPPYYPGHESDQLQCGDASLRRCVYGSLYGDDWVTVKIEWDAYRIKYYFNDNIFRSIYRTYDIFGIPINECSGPSVGQLVLHNNMFESYANMPIVSTAAVSEQNPTSDYQMEIDFVRAQKKIDCNKQVNLTSFKALSPQNVPPIAANFTPQVITGGVITASTVNVKRAGDASWYPAHLDLYASQSITLLPGFIADPSDGLQYTPSCTTNVQAIIEFQNEVSYGDGFLAQIVPCPAGKKSSSDEGNDENVSRLNERLNPDSLEFIGDDNLAEDKREEIIYGAENLTGKYYLRVYPNPAKPSQTVYIVYGLPSSDDMEITLTDLQGNVIKTIEQGFRNAAVYSLAINGLSLQAGAYFVNLKGEHFSVVRKLIITN